MINYIIILMQVTYCLASLFREELSDCNQYILDIVPGQKLEKELIKMLSSFGNLHSPSTFQNSNFCGCAHTYC